MPVVDPISAEEAIPLFDEWMAANGKREATRRVYIHAVRRALAAIGLNTMTTPALDDYAASLPPPSRNLFRSGWRLFSYFAAGLCNPHVEPPLAGVSWGRLHRRNRSTRRSVRVEDAAIAYLVRVIGLPALTRIRWPDVSFIGPADALIEDKWYSRTYRVHRRPMEVLHAFARPDGAWAGAVLPDVPNGTGHMPEAKIEARMLEGMNVPPDADPTAVFFASLVAPVQPRPEPAR